MGFFWTCYPFRVICRWLPGWDNKHLINSAYLRKQACDKPAQWCSGIALLTAPSREGCCKSDFPFILLLHNLLESTDWFLYFKGWGRDGEKSFHLLILLPLPPVLEFPGVSEAHPTVPELSPLCFFVHPVPSSCTSTLQTQDWPAEILPDPEAQLKCNPCWEAFSDSNHLGGTSAISQHGSPL